MPGTPKKRIKRLQAIEESGGYLSESDRQWLHDELEVRQTEENKKRQLRGTLPDAVEQVGGGLTVDTTDDAALVELVGHKEVWNRICVAPKEGGSLLKFTPSFWQEELFERIRTRRRQRKPTREIIIKPRQVQITTGTAAFMYAEAISEGGVPVFAVTNSDENIHRLAARYRTFIESDPVFRAQPPAYYSKNNWQGANGSSIRYHLAGNDLRGANYRHLHGTEVDFWPDFDQTMKGLMQSVARSWKSVAILESTVGDRPSEGFRQLLHSVKTGQNVEWTLWFLEWFKFPEYQAGHPSNSYEWTPKLERQLMGELTGEERGLMELGATAANIAWRRRTINAECFGKTDVFRQEYPSTLDEALEYRGSWFFQRSALVWHKKQEKDPMLRLKMGVSGTDFTALPCHNHDEAHLRIWEVPTPTKRYRLGADVAESDDLSAARSDITVLDRDTGRVVARWWGNVPAHFFGGIIHAVQGYYGNAEVMYDRTGVGAAVTGELLRLGTPNVAVGTGNKPGWHFTAETKAAILGSFQRCVDTCSYRTPCAEQLEQMRMFTGETKAAGWCDAVVSGALACYNLPEAAAWMNGGVEQEEPDDPEPVWDALAQMDYDHERLAARLEAATKRPGMFSYT